MLFCMCPQKESSVFVCELCKKHGKYITLGSSVENGRSEEISALAGLNTDPLDANLSSNVPQRQGKVCIWFF